MQMMIQQEVMEMHSDSISDSVNSEIGRIEIGVFWSQVVGTFNTYYDAIAF